MLVKALIFTIMSAALALLPQFATAFDEEDAFLLNDVPPPTHYCNRNAPEARLYILDDFTSEGHTFSFLQYHQGDKGKNFRMRMYKGTEIVILDGQEVDDYFYGFVYLDADDFSTYPDKSFFVPGFARAGRFVVRAKDVYCRPIESKEEK